MFGEMGIGFIIKKGERMFGEKGNGLKKDLEKFGLKAIGKKFLEVKNGFLVIGSKTFLE
jgi:hypothetical protein